jgi:hypothetical protein
MNALTETGIMHKKRGKLLKVYAKATRNTRSWISYAVPPIKKTLQWRKDRLKCCLSDFPRLHKTLAKG